MRFTSVLLLVGLFEVGIPQAPTVNSTVPTARIRGHVIAADTGLPVKGAQMEVISVPFRSEWRARSITDDQGGYEFRDLNPARYTLSVSKPGFVKLAYPQRVGNETSTPIQVAEGQLVNRVDFSLPRGGVIVATVVDPAGDLVAQVQIQAIRARPQAGPSSGSTSPDWYGTTNDLGQARIFGLPPGEYYLSARSVAIALLGSSPPSPTYFPGTFVAADAQRVSVTSAQEVPISMTLLDARHVTISGSVHHSDGSPVFPTVPYGQNPSGSIPRTIGYSVVLQLQRDQPSDTGQPTTAIPVQPDGTFTLGGVAPGRYDIVAMQPFPPAGAEKEYARVPLTVGVSDIDGIAVVTQKGATLRGRIVFDTGQPPPDLQPRNFPMMLYPTDLALLAGPGRMTMGSDWTFEIADVLATALLRPAQGLSPAYGWWVKSVMIGGKDYAETPFAFEPGREYRDIQVTLTQKRATVVGSVVDAQARTVGQYSIVIFPEDRALWFPRSTLMRSVQPDPQGQFAIGQLPAVRFLIAAVPALEAEQEKDVEFLVKLVPRATRLVISEGETRTMTLRRVDVP